MSVPPSRQAPGLVYEHLSIIDALRAEQMTARRIRRVREAIVRLLG